LEILLIILHQFTAGASCLKTTQSTAQLIVIPVEISVGNVYSCAFKISTVCHSVAAAIASANVVYHVVPFIQATTPLLATDSVVQFKTSSAKLAPPNQNPANNNANVPNKKFFFMCI
jgi:hypothetical protein